MKSELTKGHPKCQQKVTMQNCELVHEYLEMDTIYQAVKFLLQRVSII